VPSYGPWLVAPVTSELLRGGAEPGAVGIAATWDAEPKDVAGVASGVKVTEKLASALV